MRTNIFCIIIASICAVAVGAVMLQYQELQDYCQIAGANVDTMHGAATDIESALADGFMELNEALFINGESKNFDEDYCEEAIILLEESIGEAFGAQSPDTFENVLLREIRMGLSLLIPGLVEDEDDEDEDEDEDDFLDEEDWLDEDDLFEEDDDLLEDDWSEDDWSIDEGDWLENDWPTNEDDWPEDDWPEDEEDWSDEDIDRQAFSD